MDIIWVIDTETTGEKPETAAVCEIAAVPVYLKPARVAWKMGISNLIDPKVPVPPEARAVHHLSDAMLKGSPTLPEVMKKKFKAIKEAKTLVAHNAPFDAAFLDKVTKAEWIDTYRVARHLYPDAPNYKNQTLRYYLGCEPPVDALREMFPHQALYDTIVTAYILVHMLQENTVKGLLELSSLPVLLKICTFPKHRGELWADIPFSYLTWIMNTEARNSRNKDDKGFDPDVLHTARYWIEERRRTGRTRDDQKMSDQIGDTE